MYTTLVFDLILAFLAVFGAYALMRLFLTRLSPFSQFSLLLDLEKGTRAEDVPLLLGWARDQLFLRGECRIIVALSREQARDEALLLALREEGVEIQTIN